MFSYNTFNLIYVFICVALLLNIDNIIVKVTLWELHHLYDSGIHKWFIHLTE